MPVILPASWGLPPDLSLHWVSPFIYQWRDSGYVLCPFGPQCAQLYNGDVRALAFLALAGFGEWCYKALNRAWDLPFLSQDDCSSLKLLVIDTHWPLRGCDWGGGLQRNRKWKILWFSVVNYSTNVCVLVAQSCPILCNTMDCSPLGSSVHEISQVRILQWVAIPFSRGSSWPRDWTRVSWIAGRFFTLWATRESH